MERALVTIVDEATGQELCLSVRHGLSFQAVCTRHTTPIEFDCREADCGICIVRVEAGLEQLSPKTEAEADFLKAMRARPEERLACQARIFGPVKVRVPEP